ncbi:MAG: helicase-exonuclease AddAB subunit AddB, partial [Bacillota bacterium]|nr:helicase-exonuclease AddAB subunit AddB [Bacillota bacterium]
AKIDKSEMIKNSEIWIDEFSSFTPQQYKIIEKLMKNALKVNITLCSDCSGKDAAADNTDVFLPVKNTERKILKLAEENNIKYEKPIYLCDNNMDRFKDSIELRHLSRHFFTFPYKVYNNKTKDIEIFKALNIYSEVEETARDIIKKCRDMKLRYGNIAVVTRNLENYEKLVQVIFSQYKIPCFIDQKRDITGNPLIVFINSALEITASNWSYEAVFKFLKTGMVDIEKNNIDILENYILANGIKGNKWREEQWNYRINYGFDESSVSEYEKYILKIVNDTKQIITDKFFVFENNIKKNKNVKDICNTIYDFLISMEVPEKIEKWIEQFKSIGNQEMVNEYSQIWNNLMDFFDQIVEVMGNEEMALKKFIKTFNSGIEEYKIGLIPPALDQVLVGDLQRVRSQEIKALYIIGVNDSIFPRGSFEEGILTDKDREILKINGIELAQDTKSQAFEEQFLIYTTLNISSKYLKISYPIADSEGKTLRPSIIISRLKKIFPNVYESSDIIKKGDDIESLNLISSAEPTFNTMVTALRADFDGISANPIWWDALKWYSSDEIWKEKLSRAFEGLSYNNFTEHISRGKIKNLYGKTMKLSVSRLEKFVECPFAYYVQYGLKAKDRKVYEFSAPDLGSFIHGVLDEFYNVLEKEKLTFRDVDRNWCSYTVSYIVDKTIEEKNGYILNSSARYKYLADRLKRILTRSVCLISEHIKRSSFDPVGHEVSFGNDKEFPPIVIKMNSGEEISFIGRVDRIDEMDTENGKYIRIIDYKSGNKAFKLSDVYYGLSLQLLIYLDAILTNKEKYLNGEAMPGAVLYFKIDDPILSADGDMEEQQIEEEVMKKLKMNGLLLSDAKIVKAMDNQIDGYSLIIPAYMKKDGNLGKSSSATLEQFEILRDYVRKTLVSLCEEILNGNISILPCKKEEYTPCINCSFSAVCRFETSIKGSRYKVFKNKKDDEVWELMSKKISNDKNNTLRN